ncbi:hypothetical protein Mucpa_2312 [Mucilaginibacter paludis DSM 18603]|uniref:Uncharacterized protein n=2 Tax=Mucilaginibacter TaxID=423349 RepID=H1YHL9_9SPHI|nr:hypothetical protein Mucpa_2312 [Mucilaginibacter paludis DSM 18603]
MGCCVNVIAEVSQILTFAPMLKRFTAILLLVALIGSNCSRFFVYAGFEVNQKYIADNLCINKSKPWLHCNGHCYLMNKLRQTEEKEKKQEREEQKSRYQEALPTNPITIVFIEPTVKVEYPPSTIPGIMGRASSIFQPPRV